MRTQWLLLLCFESAAFFASASLHQLRLRHSHASSTDRRTGIRQVVSQGKREHEVPSFGVANAPPMMSLDSQRPESRENVANYKVAAPTPLPASLNGVFCRGGACQYRVPTPLSTLPPAMTPPPLPLGGNLLSGREFCKGLTCIGGMGAPGDEALAAFNVNCVHLFNDIGGGMKGEDTKRSVSQVYNSFANVCKRRVAVLEASACPVYATTFVGAVSSKVNNPTVGGTVEVCTDTYAWLLGFKQAEVDLKLVAAALPKGNSLLAADHHRLGTGGVGPSSSRGMQWREYVQTHGKWPSPPSSPQRLASNGALLQVNPDTVVPPQMQGADTEKDTPRGLPKYKQNPVPSDRASEHPAPQSHTKYQIAPGSADGAIPPVEVSGDLFTYCSNEFSEIMLGFAQTARGTVQMTKDWCAWQSSISSWVGKRDELGHPEWTHRTCSGMENFVAFALRDSLADAKTGLSSTQVCKQIFLSINAVHKTEAIIKGAWETSTRGAPSSGIPKADNSEMKKLLMDSQRYANKIYRRLRMQKAAYEKLNNAKMDTVALLALSVQQARQSD